MWTLLYDPTGSPVENSLAGWNIKNAVISGDSQAMDRLTFVMAGVNVDSPQSFAQFKECIIYANRTLNNGVFSGGTMVFRGLVTQFLPRATGDSEYHQYEFSGPWWYFQNIDMELAYNIITGGTFQNPTYEVQFSSHFIINRDLNRKPLCTGEVIEACVKYAISQKAPIQLLPDQVVDVISIPGVNNGTVSVSAGIQSYVYPPDDEVNTVSVEECLRKMFRWTPDIVAWFDYSTSPYPTFHCCRAENLTPASVNLLSGSNPNGYSITSTTLRPRYDLQKSYVWFKYEITNNVNGQESLGLVNQFYPPVLPTTTPDTFRGFVATVALSGVNIQTTTATLQTAALPSLDPSASDTMAYLKSKAQWLKDPSISTVTINSITVDGLQGSSPVSFSPTHPFEVTGGTGITAWMTDTAGNPVQTAKQTAIFNIKILNANTNLEDSHTIRVDIVTCTINTLGNLQPFTLTSGVLTPDFITPNLAEEMFTSLNVLQWDGELAAVQNEAALGIGIGNSLNIADSPAYSNMNATVQSYKIDIDNATTTLKVGPNKLLTLGQLTDLARVVRRRLILLPPNARSTGNLGGSSSLSLQEQYAAANNAGGAGYHNVVVASDTVQGTGQVAAVVATAPTSGPNTGQWGLQIGKNGDNLVQLNYPDAFYKGVAYPIRFRVCDVCVNGSPNWQAIIAMSMPFPKP